jgi:uncharacterized protein
MRDGTFGSASGQIRSQMRGQTRGLTRGQTRGLTRRNVLRWGAAATAGVCARGAAWGRALGQAGSDEQRPAFKATRLNPADYARVDLAAGPTQRQFEENHQLLLNLNEDGLLRPFRVREGLPAPGEELGGWYSTEGFAPACTFGQWMSALARMYAVTRDQSTYAKIDRMIRGYAATIEPAGRFYRHYRFPGYIYDKLSIGLTDAHVYAGHPEALDVLARATDAVLPFLPPKAMPHQETPLVADEDFTRHVWDETYTMPENLFLAWQRTGTPRYYDLAKRFLFDEYFDPLSRAENALPGRHAYSHVNALGSAAAAYLAMGDEKYLRAAKNAFAMVQKQSYATGGWGPGEHFITPGSGALGESLNDIHSSFETPCGSYAHFKIARYLLRITGDPRYGDSMEQVLYNTVLGAKPLQPDGRAFYYSDYTYDGVKGFHKDKWPCCSGTLPQIAADYRISTYFESEQGVYVNLYVPSTLRWNAGGAQIALRQTTDYPYESNVRLDVTASAPATFSVFLRIPAWTQGAELGANGMRGTRKLEAGSFAEVRREWKTGDRIELELPFTTRLEAVDAQHPEVVAVVKGPLVLMALRDGDAVLGPVTRAKLLSARQGGPHGHEWIAGSGAETLRMKAFLDIQDEPYTTYVKVAKV